MIQQCQSEQIDQLAEALAKAQAKMKVAGQTGSNPQFKTRERPNGTAFSTHKDFVDACREALTSEGVTVPTFHPEVDVATGRVYLHGRIIHGKSGQWAGGTLPLLNPKGDMQGMKSCITYASRMLFQMLTGCASGEVEDDGNATRHEVPHAERQAKGTAALTNGMAIEAKAREMIEAGPIEEAKRALSLIELRIAEGKATKAVLARCKELFDGIYQKELASV